MKYSVSADPLKVSDPNGLRVLNSILSLSSCPEGDSETKPKTRIEIAGFVIDSKSSMTKVINEDSL